MTTATDTRPARLALRARAGWCDDAQQQWSRQLDGGKKHRPAAAHLHLGHSFPS